MTVKEGMKGKEAKPENEKVRQYRMGTIDAEINKLNAHYATLKQGKANDQEQIKKLQEQVKQCDITIEKLRSAKEDLVKKWKELADMNLEVEDIEELKRQKEKLEGQVSALKGELFKASQTIEDITKTEEL